MLPGSDAGRDTPVLVAADTGGTFTDLLLSDGERLIPLKVPSTPDDPSRAVVQGLETLIGRGRTAAVLVHGTTVATNSLLERKGARTAFVTTAGFEDVLEIGRQDRPDIYALEPRRPEPIVPAAGRFGVRERTLADGSVETAPGAAETAALARRLREEGWEAVAVGFLHSYVRPDNERAVLVALRAEGLVCCGSCEVLREYREYERFSTTVANAYLLPRMGAYLRALADRAPAERIRVMQSGGGVASVERAAREPVNAILSGPAGGVLGAFHSASSAGTAAVLTLDMGGTSTDVALCPGRVQTRKDAEIGGLPLRTGVLDVHTVGAGGGSVAWVDEGGALRVGPESAGSEPGPCCYGRGGMRVTVTDADLLLGILTRDVPLAGDLRLDPSAVLPPLEALASRLGISTEETAAGVRRVVNASMERALRRISVERGHDPREFTLVAFGGAGPMHAADLAAALGVRSVLVPVRPGVLSAMGMLVAEVVRARTLTVLRDLEDADGRELEVALEELRRAAREELEREGRFERVEERLSVDLRYRGQSFDLEVEAGPGLRERFHRLHEDRYGYRDERRGVEAVTVRVRVSGTPRRPAIARLEEAGTDPRGAVVSRGSVLVGGPDGLRPVEMVRYLRERLLPGMRMEGPAVVHEDTSTTWLPPGWTGRVDGFGNLLLESPGSLR